jgi:AbrB family looped-hinge helix DNA binding protein
MSMRLDDPSLLREVKRLPSTSARIRALDAKGLSKGEIVKYLNAHFRQPGRPNDFRYQHVYNVLAQRAPTRQEADVTGEKEASPIDLPERLDVHVDSAGRIVIPAIFRSAMQVKEGDRLMARVVDGELSLISPRMAVRRAQGMVRELIPGDDSLVDGLIAERRWEAEQEMKDG